VGDRFWLLDRAAGALDRLGLLRPVARAVDRTWTRIAADELGYGPDGIALPPARLRADVSSRGTNAREFLKRGARAAATVRSAAESAGVELEALEVILDFGCGCGRVARRWANLDGPEIHGCDPSQDAVSWCRENLGFLEATVSRDEPPAPYPPQRFDLIYAFSVFTHLTEPLQRSWAEELARIAKPNGLLLLTTHGDAYRDRLPAAERSRYDRGEIVVRYPRSTGANICGAHHPFSAMTALLEHASWELVSFDPAGARGVGRQDLYLARAPRLAESGPSAEGGGRAHGVREAGPETTRPALRDYRFAWKAGSPPYLTCPPGVDHA
jgi:SAM-dependent methyltransferase